MKKSITKNYIYNLIYQILVTIVPLITTPYLSRVLGAEKIGIYSYTLSITTYFILLGSLGVSTYGQREIAYVRDDAKLRTRTFIETLIMRAITLTISIILFYFTFAISGEYSMYYKILLLEIIANIVDISWFFQGQEEFKKTVMRNIIVKIISVVCIFIFVKTQEDLSKYFLIYVLSTLLGNLSLWMYVPKYIEKINLKELKVFRHLRPSIELFIPQIAVQIYTVLDKTMIGTMVEDKSEVGFYEQAQKIVKLMVTISTSLGAVMVPRMANTYAIGDNDKLKEYMYKSFHFTLLIAFPLMFGVISVASKFVPIFYGDGYDKVTVLINIISPIILAIGLSSVTGTQYLIPTKQQKKYTISVTLGAIVNFCLNIILIKALKAIGASIATVIAEFSVTGIQFYLLRNEINISDVIKIAKNYFIASVLMFIISCIMGLIIPIPILSIVIQIVLGAITYFAILIILKDEFIGIGMDKIKSKFSR